jgi:TolB protein
MNADGRNQRRLTFEERADAAPLWSPDGTGIAFVSTRSGDWDTYVMAANGRSPRRLLRSRSAGIHPVWSPSGSEIALVVDGGDRWELRIVRPDGSGERQLSATATGAGWSPDGRRIAFCRDGAVWVINADGTHRRHLTDPKARYSEDEGCDLGIDESPAWSPDGKQIAYVGTRSGEIQPDLTPEYTKRDIYVIDPERGGEQRLTG